MGVCAGVPQHKLTKSKLNGTKAHYGFSQKEGVQAAFEGRQAAFWWLQAASASPHPDNGSELFHKVEFS